MPYPVVSAVLPVLLVCAAGSAQEPSPTPVSPGAARKRPGIEPPLGRNPAAGGTFVHDGVRLYFEQYGTGQPLLLIHGNGGSIGDLKAQIDYFRKMYRVTVMDSRSQGKSGDGPDRITYEMMTDDLAALLKYLNSPPTNVIGWSDGGIEALLLAIHYPGELNKVAIMSANLNPDGAYLETIALVQRMIDGMPASEKESPRGKQQLRLLQMMLEEPRIEPNSLGAITAPVLVMAGDHDLIRDEHTLEMYHHIPNSQLCIFPNATHLLPYDDPALFNSTVERFFRAPFVKKNRISDAVRSLRQMRAYQRQ